MRWRARDVGSKFEDIVGFHSGRLIAAVAALIGNSDLKAGGNQSDRSDGAQIPGLRPAVERDHKGAVTFDHCTKSDAVGLEHLKVALLQRSTLRERGGGRYAKWVMGSIITTILSTEAAQ